MPRLALLLCLALLAGCKSEVSAPGVKVSVGPGGAKVDAPGVKIEAGPGGAKVDVEKKNP